MRLGYFSSSSSVIIETVPFGPEHTAHPMCLANSSRDSYGYARTRPLDAIGVWHSSVSPIANPNVSDTISHPRSKRFVVNSSESLPISLIHLPGSIFISVFLNSA